MEKPNYGNVGLTAQASSLTAFAFTHPLERYCYKIRHDIMRKTVGWSNILQCENEYYMKHINVCGIKNWYKGASGVLCVQPFWPILITSKAYVAEKIYGQNMTFGQNIVLSSGVGAISCFMTVPFCALLLGARNSVCTKPDRMLVPLYLNKIGPSELYAVTSKYMLYACGYTAVYPYLKNKIGNFAPITRTYHVDSFSAGVLSSLACCSTADFLTLPIALRHNYSSYRNESYMKSIYDIRFKYGLGRAFFCTPQILCTAAQIIIFNAMFESFGMNSLNPAKIHPM